MPRVSGLHKTNGTSIFRPSRIVLVDDHDLAREVLRSLLQRERDLDVVGEAASTQEALALSCCLQPDLVLMVVRLPNGDGLKATRIIRQEHAGTAVLMVSMHEDPDYFFEAVESGAAGYVVKGASRTEVMDAVRRDSHARRQVRRSFRRCRKLRS